LNKIVEKSNWYNGTFYGSFKNSIWYDGIFENGEFIDAIWHDGVWKNG
jgi:hypothetical protein